MLLTSLCALGNEWHFKYLFLQSCLLASEMEIIFIESWYRIKTSSENVGEMLDTKLIPDQLCMFTIQLIYFANADIYPTFRRKQPTSFL